MYRSASLTLAPRSDSPRSTRSAPYPAGVAASGGGGSVLNRSSRGESPRSVRSAAPAPDSHSYRVSRRTSSVDSQSSVDSRGHRRYGEHFAFDSVFCYYFFTPKLYIFFPTCVHHTTQEFLFMAPPPPPPTGTAGAAAGPQMARARPAVSARREGTAATATATTPTTPTTTAIVTAVAATSEWCLPCLCFRFRFDRVLEVKSTNLILIFLTQHFLSLKGGNTITKNPTLKFSLLPSGPAEAW